MISVVEFEHGKETCASEPGKFCRFLYARSFGTRPVCHLFADSSLYAIKEGEFKGWLGRSPECLLLTEEKKDV